MLDGADGSAALLVVTDDRDLRHGAAHARRPDGALGLAPRPPRNRPSRLAVGGEPATRARRTAHPADGGQPEDGDPAETDRPSWKPGRGATTKKGNPRKAPKASGTDRMRP